MPTLNQKTGIRRVFICAECGEGWETKHQAFNCCLPHFITKDRAATPDESFRIFYICEICDYQHETRADAWDCCQQERPPMPAHVAHVWAEKAGQARLQL